MSAKSPNKKAPKTQPLPEFPPKGGLQYARILPPLRSFEVGDGVEFGHRLGCTVTRKTEDGLYYEASGIDTNRNGQTPFLYSAPWYCFVPAGTAETRKQSPRMAVNDDLRYRTLSLSVGGLLSRVESAGVDFDPPYQRGHVWELPAKLRLLDTIFDRGTIGTFAFCMRDYGFKGPLYEVVDGKQRLTALVEFAQDQFRFRGLLYSEMHCSDRSLFDNCPTTVYDLEEGGEKDVLRLFLRINREGTPVDEKHIEMVRARLEEISKS